MEILPEWVRARPCTAPGPPALASRQSLSVPLSAVVFVVGGRGRGDTRAILRWVGSAVLHQPGDDDLDELL